MRKIMTVDDSPVVLKMVERTIRGLGFEPVSAVNGSEALERYYQHDISLLVTDINMPVMNGFELIRALRTRNVSVPILVLTTESDKALIKEATEAGANGWLEKPPVPSVLREYIERLLPEVQGQATTAYPVL